MEIPPILDRAIPLPAVTRRRLDSLLAERGLTDSRARAASAVRSGRVRIGRDGPIAGKPGQLVAADAELLVEEGRRYVSRGGLKLEHALDLVPVDPAGRRCLDAGASTGGFTECLLRRGAEHVVALDVGYGQLDWGLRNDPRVTVLERMNVRHLRAEHVPYTPELATVDVSFISLEKVLPAIAGVLDGEGEILALVKPQFEVGRRQLGRGGVVRAAADRRGALRSVAECCQGIGLVVRGFAPSGLPGPKGNRETFVWVARKGPAVEDLEAALRIADPDEPA